MSELYLWRYIESGNERIAYWVAKTLIAMALGWWARRKGFKFSAFFLVSFFLDPLVCAAALAVVPKVCKSVDYSVARAPSDN